MGQLPRHLVLLLKQQFDTGKVFEISDTFTIDDSGMQTRLQHENMLVAVQNHWK